MTETPKPKQPEERPKKVAPGPVQFTPPKIPPVPRLLVTPPRPGRPGR